MGGCNASPPAANTDGSRPRTTKAVKASVLMFHSSSFDEVSRSADFVITTLPFGEMTML